MSGVLIKKILSKCKSINNISLKNIKKCSDDGIIIEYSKLQEYIDNVQDYIRSQEKIPYNDGTVSICYNIKNLIIKNSKECKENNEYINQKLYLENFTDENITIKIYNIDINTNILFRGTGTWIDKFMFFEFIQNDKVKMLIELRYIHEKRDYEISCSNKYIIAPKIHIIN